MPYIYIIHCRASINCGENVYKIGKTDNICNRIHGYDKGSVAIFSLFVCNSDSFEKHLIALFTEQFIKRHDYGNEYFEGSLSKMISLIMIEFNKVDTYIYDIKHGETIVKKIKEPKKIKKEIPPPPEWADIFDEHEDFKFCLWYKATIWKKYYGGNRWDNYTLSRMNEIKTMMNEYYLFNIYSGEKITHYKEIKGN